MTEPATSPAAALERAFSAIQSQRMGGMPFVNPSLKVEAVGFAPWNGHWLGVLVTPWFMNLVLLPHDAARWHSVRLGETTSHTFPAGVFEFIAGDEPGLGEFQACSLFSPMFEFADQASARHTARAALEALFDAGNRAEALPRDAAPKPEPAPAPAAAGMTKRQFLRGDFTGSGGERRG